MARKNDPTVPGSRHKALRVDRRRAPRPLVGAHPLLVHGFLVRLTARPAAGVAAAKSAFTAAAGVTARVQRASAMKHEGPADDATFH